MNRSGVNLEALVLHMGAIARFTSAETNYTKGENKPEFDLNGLKQHRCENTLNLAASAQVLTGTFQKLHAHVSGKHFYGKLCTSAALLLLFRRTHIWSYRLRWSHVWWYFTGCHGAHETMMWSVLLPWWQRFSFVSCRIRLHSRLLISERVRVCVLLQVHCTCSSAHFVQFRFTVSMFSSLRPAANTSPSKKSFLSAWEAETCPGSTDLTLRPQGVAVHYCFQLPHSQASYPCSH